MSGLYNALFSTDSIADELLAMLGTSRNKVPRFRDCYLTEDGIAIHTRTGGGNREDYEDENDYLTTLPGYRYDEDNDFDCTYADFYYDVPEAFAEQVRAWLAEHGTPPTPGEKWSALFEALRAGHTAA